MRYFEVNEELGQVLLDQGLIDTTSEFNQSKGKKSYKTSRRARKEVRFDYIQLQIISGAVLYESMRLSEYELRLVLLFLKMDSKDYTEIDPRGSFNPDKASVRLESIKEELAILERTNYKQSRQHRLRRILALFDAIQVLN